jgi:capsular exopolysaccharide synthesis family protein
VEYRQWIVGVTLAATLVGCLYAFLATRKYTATATVFIDRGAQKGPKDISNVSSTDLTTELYFNSQADIMKSKAVLKEAVDALDLSHSPSFQGKDPVRALRKMTTVARKRDSALFTISVTAPDQKNVAAWANGIAEAYDRVTLRQKLEYLQEADRLMADQTAKMEKEYDRLKQAYGEHLQATGTYFPQNQKLITDSRIQGLEMRRNDVFMKKNEAAAKLSQLKGLENPNRDPLTVAFVQSDPASAGLVQQYIAAEKELAALSVKYTPKHPAVIKKTEELQGLKQRIRTQALNYAKAVQSEYSSYVQEYASLTGELDSLKAQAIQVTEGTSQSESLETGVESVHKYMEMLVEKMREVDVAASLMSNATRIVDRAEMPRSASKPNRKMVVLLSFMLGFMGSVGSIFAVRAIDTRIRQPEEIEKKLHVPLLATIPVHSGESKPIVVEAFQNLRTSLVYCSDHKAKRVLMVTSASAGEGKSTVASNLGITLAAAGDRVLLMDCDARKSTLHKFLQLENKAGLSEYLASNDDDPAPYILPAKKVGLFLLPAGKTPANPPNLFSMGKFHRLIQTVKGSYDWIIVDTPPVLAVTDATIIADEVDLILLVARARFTHLPLMLQALQQFSRIDRAVAGAVLNQFEYERHYYYRDYYYRHYHYYYGKQPPKTWWDKAKRPFLPKPRPASRRTTV